MEETTLKEEALIACVDNDPTVLEALEDLLDVLEAFRVDGFLSAEEFLQARPARSNVVLDCGHAIRWHVGHPASESPGDIRCAQIPMIIISAFADERMRAEALQSGAVCVLGKPVGRADLLESIRDALDRARDIRNLDQEF